MEVIKIGAIVIIVSAFFLSRLFKKGVESNNEMPKKRGKSSSKSASISFKEGCMEELSSTARNFEFLFEKTYLLVTGSSSMEEIDAEYLISEWELRLKNNSDMYLIEAWKSFVKKHTNKEYYREVDEKNRNIIVNILRDWTTLLTELGIRRDDKIEFTIEDNSIHHVYLIEELWKVNDTLIVTQPAWFFKGKYVEKGIAKVKSPNNVLNDHAAQAQPAKPTQGGTA